MKSELTATTDHPGGNIVVESIEGDRVCVDRDSFRYAFPEHESEGWFSFGIPYLERDLAGYLRTRPLIETSVLVRSEKGRDVERPWMT